MLLRDESHLKEINRLKRQVSTLQRKLRDMEMRFEEEIGIKKCHILRVKNGEDLADDYILNNQSYLDLSPEKAFEIYNEVDRDYILLDVSRRSYNPPMELPEALKLPLEELEHNLHKLAGKGKSYIVISEDGIRSIHACKLLNRKGFYNLSNVSGGYMYWPGFKRLPVKKSNNSAA